MITCKECKWWDNSEYVEEKEYIGDCPNCQKPNDIANCGVCTNVEMLEKMFIDGVDWDNVLVKKDFGCIHAERKEE